MQIEQKLITNLESQKVAKRFKPKVKNKIAGMVGESPMKKPPWIMQKDVPFGLTCTKGSTISVSRK